MQDSTQYLTKSKRLMLLAIALAVLWTGCPSEFPNMVVVTPATATIEVGKVVDLEASSTQFEEQYTWVSSDASIATVSPKGVVTGVNPGTATITATGDLSGDSGQAEVTVEAATMTFDTPTVQSREALPEDAGTSGVVVTLDNGEKFILDAPDIEMDYATRSPDWSGGDKSLEQMIVDAERAKQRPVQTQISLATHQTPIRNQRDRGTCVVHATLAALEAAYSREGLPNLDLSEQYLQHIGKTQWIYDFDGDDDAVHTREGWENQLAMGGGGNINHALTLLMAYRVCEEQFAPYEYTVGRFGHSWGDWANVNQPGDDPRLDWRDRSGGVSQTLVSGYNMIQDNICIDVPNQYCVTPLPQDAIDFAIYGITGYERVPRDMVDDPVWYEQQIAAGREVITNLNFVSETENDILYPRDRNEGEGNAWHAVLIVGYDRTDSDEPFFLVKNSWGESGFIKLSYDWLAGDKHGHINDAAYITGVVTPNPSERPPQLFMGRWRLVSDDVVGTLDIHRNSQYYEPHAIGGKADYRLGAFYTNNGDLYRVNGTIDDEGRMEAYIDFDNPNVDYETRDGLRFTGDIHRGDTQLTAGFYEAVDGSTPKNSFYATKRDAFNGVTHFGTLQIESFLGAWRIESPLVEGMLEVRHVDENSNTFSGRYVIDAGAWVVANGTVNPNTREFTFNVPITNGGDFSGYIHANQLGIISGTLSRVTDEKTGMVLVREGPATEIIEIIEPVNGASFTDGATISLDSEVHIDGRLEPNALVVWTEGGPYDPADPTAHRILSQSGPSGAAKLGPGTYDIYATYVGMRRVWDMVTISVSGANDPTVAITSPENDSYHQDLGNIPPSVSVSFTGEATAVGGASLSGGNLQWYYREAGEDDWTPAGTGANVVIDLMDVQCDPTEYDIRLEATDGAGNSASTVIRVLVAAFLC